jgi:hypothetical protein
MQGHVVFDNHPIPAGEAATTPQIEFNPSNVLRLGIAGIGTIELLTIGVGGRETQVAATWEGKDVRESVALHDFDKQPVIWPTHFQVRIRAGEKPVRAIVLLFG